MMVMRIILAATTLALACAASAAEADQIVTFEASGLFADGAALGGTYTVDTTTGAATALDLTFGAPVSSTATILDGSTLIGSDYVQFSLNNSVGPNYYPGFTFVIGAPSLTGYRGGPIAGVLFLDSQDVSNATVLVSGSLTAVPEPETWSLLLIGFGVVGSAVRSRRRLAVPAP